MPNSRSKGARGELEAAVLLQELGLAARRAQQYCGKAGDADLILEAPLHVEVKRTERLSPYQFMEQARRDCKPASKRVPIVLMRSNNKPWLVLIDASDWVRVSEILLHARVQAECRVPEAL